MAPDFSRWEANFTYLDDDLSKDKTSGGRHVNASELARRIKQIVTTKTGSVVHEVTSYVSGKESDRWYNGKIQYEKQTGATQWFVKNDIILNGKLSDMSYVSFPASGFRNLEWVNAKTFAGTILYGEHASLVFLEVGADKVDLNVDASRQRKVLDAQHTVAYVDADTRFPIALREGRDVRVYRFDQPPTEMQTLPSDLSAEIKKGDDARTRLLQMAPRPY